MAGLSPLIAFSVIVPLVAVVQSDASLIRTTSLDAPRNKIVTAQINPYAANPYGAPTAFDAQPESDKVVNDRMWHAFALVGTERLFASHLTNLFLEVHKYQLVMEISLPEPYKSILTEEQKRHPDESYFLANIIEDQTLGSDASDPMNLPELAAGRRHSFVANIWRGLPNKPEYKNWPWQGVRPVLSNVPVSVERIVHYKPFSGSMNHPERLTYLLFGAGDEAHMVHLQTMHKSKSGKYDPDYDHVATLTEAPEWLAPELLEAGVIIDLPDKSRFGNAEDKSRKVRCKAPFEDESETAVRYRGEDTSRTVKIGTNKWFCTRIANDPDPCRDLNTEACGTETPKKYITPISGSQQKY